MCIRKFIISLSVFVLPYTALNAEICSQIINVGSRTMFSLDGDWHYIVDPQNIGIQYNTYSRIAPEKSYFGPRDYYRTPENTYEVSFDRAPVMKVPGDWNTQDPQLFYYEGVVWYRKNFEYHPKTDERQFLYFGAVNYNCEVALNGRLLGKHEGGFTPFNFEVTGLLRDGGNYIVVYVDNTRRKNSVPTLVFDWWNYGGITRSVGIIETPSVFVRDYSVKLAKEPVKGRRQICGYVNIDGKSDKVIVKIPELKVRTEAVPAGDGHFEFCLACAPELWSPENPRLYEVEISCGADVVKDEIGFRTIETEGQKILLNGNKIFCKGVCLHEESVGTCRRIINHDENVRLLSLAKEMGCNFVRLAHYPYNEDMIRTAEKMGILVWEEIPVYWSIDWDNPDTYACAENQLQEIVTRDRNRANVIIWSVANETQVSESRNKFLKKLIAKAKDLDDTRLVSAALLTKKLTNGTKTVSDAILEDTDLVSFNVYMGWYDGNPEVCDTLKWMIPISKPVFISEFGCGAQYGFHDTDKTKFSEEFMARCYKHNLAMFEKIPGLSGTTPWILKDFRSPRRLLTGIQDNFNRKGLVSENGEKKSAFYIIKEWYEDNDNQKK